MGGVEGENDRLEESWLRVGFRYESFESVGVTLMATRTPS